MLIGARAGTGGDVAVAVQRRPSRETFDADAVLEATAAMERLRGEAAEREADAHERHLEARRRRRAQALRRRAARASTTTRPTTQRRAEAQMREELAREEAAERRAQAAAVARALRRP